MPCATPSGPGLPDLPSTLRCALGESLTLAPVQASAPCTSSAVFRSVASLTSLKSVRPSCLPQPPSDPLAWLPASSAVGPNAASTLSSFLPCFCAPTIPQGASSMPLPCPPQPGAATPGASPPSPAPATGSICSPQPPTPGKRPPVRSSPSTSTTPPATSPPPYAPTPSVLSSPPPPASLPLPCSPLL